MRKSIKEAVDFDNVADKVVAIIKGKGHNVILFTDDGMETTDPEEARRFYVKDPNYMITVDQEAGLLRINKNSNVELAEIEGVLKQIRNLARNYMLKSQLQVFGKEIAPKDFAYQAKKLRDQKMNGISEAALSRMSGSKKTSYQTLESTKIIVRHRKPVDEDVRGSRSRQIKAIFIEQAGERFRFPHNHLAGARAMARHIDEGGTMHDSVGAYIIESVANLKQLMEFMRYTRSNKLINEQSEDIIKIVRENVAAYKREIQRFQGAKSYGQMCEQIASREGSELEEDTAELQDMFTVRKFDEKIGDTLPLIKRLVTEKNAWRSMIEEASTEAFVVTSTEDLIEGDVLEFDSPVQKMGYRIRALSERVIAETDLSSFIARIGNKLIEGSELSTFEKSVARNVLENVEVAEEEVEEEAGFVDKIDEVSAEYEAKVTDLAEQMPWDSEINEDYKDCPDCNGGYTQDGKDCNTCEGNGKVNEAEAVKTACSKCNGTGKAPGESDGQYDRKIFSAVSCKACGGYGYGLHGDPARGLGKVSEDEGRLAQLLRDPNKGKPRCKTCMGSGVITATYKGELDFPGPDDYPEEDFDTCPTCGGTGFPVEENVNEEDGEKCIRCRQGTMELGDTMMGPVKQCDRCGYQLQVDEMLEDDWDDEVRRGESEAGCGMGMPAADCSNGNCPECGGTGEQRTGQGDAVPGLRYACERCDGEGNIAENVDPEDFMDECPHCRGDGIEPNQFDVTGALDKCSECGGEGYV